MMTRGYVYITDCMGDGNNFKLESNFLFWPSFALEFVSRLSSIENYGDIENKYIKKVEESTKNLIDGLSNTKFKESLENQLKNIKDRYNNNIVPIIEKVKELSKDLDLTFLKKDLENLEGYFHYSCWLENENIKYNKPLTLLYYSLLLIIEQDKKYEKILKVLKNKLDNDQKAFVDLVLRTHGLIKGLDKDSINKDFSDILKDKKINLSKLRELKELIQKKIMETEESNDLRRLNEGLDRLFNFINNLSNERTLFLKYFIGILEYRMEKLNVSKEQLNKLKNKNYNGEDLIEQLLEITKEHGLYDFYFVLLVMKDKDRLVTIYESMNEVREFCSMLLKYDRLFNILYRTINSQKLTSEIIGKLDFNDPEEMDKYIKSFNKKSVLCTC